MEWFEGFWLLLYNSITLHISGDHNITADMRELASDTKIQAEQANKKLEALITDCRQLAEETNQSACDAIDREADLLKKVDENFADKVRYLGQIQAHKFTFISILDARAAHHS